MQACQTCCLISAAYETQSRNSACLSDLLWRRVGFLLAPTTIQRGFMIIYTICLVVGLAFAFISAIAGHFFGGHDGGGSVGTGGSGAAGPFIRRSLSGR